MDKIYIRDLALRCIIGIYPEERRDRQDVIINVTMSGDFSAAGLSDDIDDAVNYKTITNQMIALVEESSFNLIETLADKLADICLEHPKVEEATVSVDKPGALRFARSVAFETTRRR
ncbi:MAG: dihydroneopterin aldolase [Kiritimatiellae bacterium]|nr:dihydroneopterin aldolase [Kiritimatiellia bacterium]MCO5060803.1 dihydroneopterin aldolase [Kiritimatiellia bacterium]MCO5068807.1 dihydroneopterin aldolase [Kiritimatiellia bacterium]